MFKFLKRRSVYTTVSAFLLATFMILMLDECEPLTSNEAEFPSELVGKGETQTSLSTDADIAKTAMADKLAQMLAGSMDIAEVRQFVKAEASKQFDGDYDILFDKMKNKELEISQANARGNPLRQSFIDVLAGTPKGKRYYASTGELQAFIDSLQVLYPLIQVSIPQLEHDSAENWNIETHEPLVAFVPSEHDETTTQFITAYDSKGKSYQLDAQNEPDRLVIVVSENERLIVVPNTSSANSRKTNTTSNLTIGPIELCDDALP